LKFIVRGEAVSLDVVALLALPFATGERRGRDAGPEPRFAGIQRLTLWFGYD
jgi:hypothetical protein